MFKSLNQVFENPFQPPKEINFFFQTTTVKAERKENLSPVVSTNSLTLVSLFENSFGYSKK